MKLQVGLDLIYQLCLVPEEDIVLAWEDVIQPYFDEHFPVDSEVDNFLNYVECTYTGKINARTSLRKNPMFPFSMWNMFKRIMDDLTMTNNSSEAWNSHWNA